MRTNGDGRLTERELSTMRKSVISAPAWPPTPTPARPIALGADQAKMEESYYCSNLLVRRKRELTSIVETCDDDSTSTTSGKEEARFDNGEDGETACAFEYITRDDLISKSWFRRVGILREHERRQDHYSRYRRNS